MARPSTSASRQGTAVSSRSRPRTNGSFRPGTSGGGGQRPDTAESTISTLGPAERTFRPDQDEFDEEEMEDTDEGEESEAEDGVFAFSRPQTGKPPPSSSAGGSVLSSFSQSGRFSLQPSTSGAYIDNNSNRQSYNSSTIPEATSTLPTFAYSASSPTPNRPSTAVSTSSPLRQQQQPRLRSTTNDTYDSRDDHSSFKEGEEKSSDRDHEHGIPLRSFTSLVPEPMMRSDGGTGSVSASGTGTGTGSGSGSGRDSRLWANRRRSGAGEGGGGQDQERRASRRISSLGGTETIPDGAQMREVGRLSGQTMDDYEKGEIGADMHEDDSPYDEVRASVSNIDDPEMPALTFRVWVIGILLSLAIAAINTFLYFRNNSPSIPSILILLVAFPMGKVLAWSLPLTEWTIPSRVPVFGGWSFSLNPGPFNIKEHALIAMMASVSNVQAYALQASVASAIYYKVDFPIGFEFLLVLSTQLTGLTLAGWTRRFLIWPASLIWPQVLIICTILNTLHAEDDGFDGQMTRHRFFFIFIAASFFYYFLPGYLFGALSYFSWVCWIKPNNVVVNQLFGSATGLGMGILTFDWSQINWIGSPLVSPWWAEVNIGVGFVLGFWIIVPCLYYTNVWNFRYLPILSSTAFDRFGRPYNYTRVLSPTKEFDATAYAAYSPVYLTASFAMVYIIAMALTTAALVHTALFYGKTIWEGIKGNRVEEDDVHARLMRSYPEVPKWWYGLAFLIFFVFGVCAVQIYPTGFPVWGVMLALVLPVVYYIPNGYVYALTGQSTSLINVVSQVIPGYLFQGRPIACMLFKAFAVETLYIGGAFSLSMKLGHYIKIPPRKTFAVQVVVVFSTCIIQVAVKQWLFHSTPDICQSTNKNQLFCPRARVFFTASVLWGLIGPERQFGRLSLYHPALYALAIGAVLPIPVWLWARRHPRSWVRNINFIVLLNGPTSIPAATGVNYASFVLVGFIFQYVIRRRNFAWWSKYCYLLSAALDTGTILSILAIFLCLQLPKNGALALNWRGNLVFQNTLDWQGVALSEAPEAGFGPTTWPV